MHKATQPSVRKTTLPAAPKVRIGYDPELLYVECSRCGSPVLWETGRTTAILREAGLDHSSLDARHLVLTNGCPTCSPEEGVFETRVVLLGVNGPQGLRPKGGTQGRA